MEELERVRGVEPPSLPWQGSVIAVILHPHFIGGRSAAKLLSH